MRILTFSSHPALICLCRVARFLGFPRKPKKGENIMAQEFVSDSIPPDGFNCEPVVPERERGRVVLYGSRDGIIENIHTLHKKGFAEVSAWSPLMPTGNPGELMCILTRYRKRLPTDNRKSGR